MDPLIPPLRFHVVQPDLYCGSYPRPRNRRFLEGLGLTAILSVTPTPLGTDPDEDAWLVEFARENNIQLIHIPSAPASSKSKKKRGVPLEYDVARKALQVMIDQTSAPLYVHCMNGSQVSCLLVACLRKLSFWSMAAISDEFLRYCDMEPADANFVEGFRAEISVPEEKVPWIWQGLSKTGVVRHHPTLKFNDMA
ncbi:uncharacterized protein SAPINGB_P004325 [Magnusiomyces paraingens]|uniref:Tyrosine specific protein phosphatases domain-containing protein n=1 Tax=Magnusiomyces paraingens TaxID=2606893 RepID=A0A5E8BTW3_9ASCO|nr:uncharacterized protein SAPINGB_P004325 [Saprochaete ingens]VVT54913.1 unnamed protein product [Saprochaete ingens]